MARSTRALVGFAVALALGAPTFAHAQAHSRTSGSSSSGASSSGSSGSSGSTAPSMPAPPPQAHARTAPAGSRTGSTAHARPATSSHPSSSTAVRGRSPAGATNMPVYARDRNGRPVVGTAVPRRSINTGSRTSVIVGPAGWWYPWYGPGLSWNLGYVGYDPWLYGSTSWIYGRYGLWYDPWGYSGYGYGYGSPYPYAPYAGSEERYAETGELTGSLRLKVKPDTAKVYVDGALMGTASEFAGLFHHLELPAGAHELQFRADGYEPYTVDITVAAGKTMTERISLKKK